MSNQITTQDYQGEREQRATDPTRQELDAIRQTCESAMQHLDDVIAGNPNWTAIDAAWQSLGIRANHMSRRSYVIETLLRETQKDMQKVLDLRSTVQPVDEGYGLTTQEWTQMLLAECVPYRCYRRLQALIDASNWTRPWKKGDGVNPFAWQLRNPRFDAFFRLTEDEHDAGLRVSNELRWLGMHH
jgi:hypothetical protein